MGSKGLSGPHLLPSRHLDWSRFPILFTGVPHLSPSPFLPLSLSLSLSTCLSLPLYISPPPPSTSKRGKIRVYVKTSLGAPGSAPPRFKTSKIPSFAGWEGKTHLEEGAQLVLHQVLELPAAEGAAVAFFGGVAVEDLDERLHGVLQLGWHDCSTGGGATHGRESVTSPALFLLPLVARVCGVLLTFTAGLAEPVGNPMWGPEEGTRENSCHRGSTLPTLLLLINESIFINMLFSCFVLRLARGAVCNTERERERERKRERYYVIVQPE